MGFRVWFRNFGDFFRLSGFRDFGILRSLDFGCLGGTCFFLRGGGGSAWAFEP